MGALAKIFWYLDRIVISSASFPMNYWDKFVRKKAVQKYAEQVNESTLNALLGFDKSSEGQSRYVHMDSFRGITVT